MLFRKRRGYRIHGEVSAGFESVKDLFESGFARGLESAAQLCVYVENECVVDLWGVSGNEEYDSYSGDSLQNVFSSTKSLAAVVFATLVDRGLLSYDDLVRKHWPEFVGGGKEDLRVCDILRHEAGIVTLDQTVMLEDLLPANIRRNAVGSVIESQIPSFPVLEPHEEPTTREYHSVTRGWILNEIFRRVDPRGRTLGEYTREEVAPKAADGVFIGVNEEEMERVSPVKGWTVQRAALESLVPSSLGRRTESSAAGMLKLARRLRGLRRKSGAAAKDNRPPVIEGMDRVTANTFVAMFNRPAVREGETPSGNGSCSARGLAAVGVAMATGTGRTAGGSPLMAPETVEAMHAELKLARDVGIGGMITEFSQGGVNLYRCYDSDSARERREKRPREGFFGWQGFGGSVFQWHRGHQVSFAYAPTKLAWHDLQNLRGARLQGQVVRCVVERNKSRGNGVANGSAK